MLLLYTHENRFMVENIKNLLEPMGFELMIKNEFANGGIGELAVFDCWPELWLADENDFSAAKRALDNILSNSEQDWACPHCQENNAGSFELCWNCNQEKSLLSQ